MSQTKEPLVLVRPIWETGCRSGEAFNLESEDVDEENEFVHIRSTAHWRMKNQGSIRRIPVSPMLISDLIRAAQDARKEVLENDLMVSTLVFVGRDGGRVWDFGKSLATAIKKASVTRNGQPTHIAPHMFPKVHATWLKRSGIDD